MFDLCFEDDKISTRLFFDDFPTRSKCLFMFAHPQTWRFPTFITAILWAAKPRDASPRWKTDSLWNCWCLQIHLWWKKWFRVFWMKEELVPAGVAFLKVSPHKPHPGLPCDQTGSLLTFRRNPPGSTFENEWDSGFEDTSIAPLKYSKCCRSVALPFAECHQSYRHILSFVLFFYLFFYCCL